VLRSALTEPLYRLAGEWRDANEGPRRRGAAALVAVVWVLALIGARYGTPRARVLAGLAMALSAAAAVALDARERRRLAEPALILARLAAPVDRRQAERALRALSLVGVDGEARPLDTSAELARLHVSRALAALPADRIVERGARVATLVARAALVIGVCALGIAFANAWSVLEGADVLAARHHLAPVTMDWLGGIQLVARPPDYVHQEEIRELDPGPMLLPYGTVLALHGAPLHPGRSLRLSDGVAEAPFVDDGTGGLVARWTLTASSDLRVVARFGEVTITEPQALSVECIPDRAPVVSLEGAPRKVLLADETEDIPIRYQASDDHGLREVHMVLRAGVREDRRVLARLDGELRSEGGHMLRLRDGFLKKSHVPVQVTVEAKDNDPLTGPKWGVSPAITVVPPDVGEPEARRLDALRALRDRVVDTLALRLAQNLPDAPAARKAFAAEDRARAEGDDEQFLRTVGDVQGGVRVPARSRMLLAAQVEHLHQAALAQARAPSAATRSAVVKGTERLVLVVDAIVRGLGLRDARAAAKELSEVAEDLAAGAGEGQGDDEASHVRAATRMDAATGVLSGGAVQLARLGALGRDLGEIVDADLLRVRRARDEKDLPHAELAARDLAARLAQPDPSFGSRGGGGPRSAGGESGGARGAPGEESEPPDEVEQAFREAASDLEHLAQEHAGEIGKIEQALAAAAAGEDQGPLRDEARRHAAAVRDAVRPLPPVGSGSDSWTSKGAAARELAEQMARSLEQGRVDEAAQSGRSASAALEEARRMLETGGWLQDPGGSARQRVDDARRKLEMERAWAESQVERMRKRTAERARSQLEEGGQDEGRLAERARKLGDRERDRGSFPEEAVESIDDAARAARQAADALQRGDAEQGMKHQREAQRDLEAANEKLRGDDDSSAHEGEVGAPLNEAVDIPDKGKHKGPTEFRRRVVEGLAMPSSGGLKDAVRRYAEGLLR
jgi:hypothetical protein